MWSGCSWNKSDVEYGGGETALTTQTSAGAPLKMEFTDSDEEVQVCSFSLGGLVL